jgi:hypothetical protein
MTGRADDMARLCALAALVRDARLASLRDRAAGVAHLRAQIAQLDAARQLVPKAEVLCTAPAYLRWQARTRADLNIRLAAALAAEARARDTAQAAFGRAEILARLARRQKRRPDQAS